MVNRDFHPPPAGLGGPAGEFIIVVNRDFPPPPAGLGGPAGGFIIVVNNLIRREARQFEVASPRPAAAEKLVAAPEGDGVEGFERPAAKYKR
jgi:hypothetical protein